VRIPKFAYAFTTLDITDKVNDIHPYAFTVALLYMQFAQLRDPTTPHVHFETINSTPQGAKHTREVALCALFNNRVRSNCMSRRRTHDYQAQCFVLDTAYFSFQNQYILVYIISNNRFYTNCNCVQSGEYN
jgi:hypothetical protein